MGAQVVWRPPLDPGVEIGELEVANTQGLSWRWVVSTQVGKVWRPPLDRRGLQCCSRRPAGHSLRFLHNLTCSRILLAPEFDLLHNLRA